MLTQPAAVGWMVEPAYPKAVACWPQEKKKEGVPAGDIEGASVEELNQKITTIEKEKNKEEEYRNYMQLERVSKRQQGTPRGLSSACGYSTQPHPCRCLRAGSLSWAISRTPVPAQRLRKTSAASGLMAGPLLYAYRIRSMHSGRLQRRTWMTRRRSCATRTGRWRRWRSDTK